jgi:D-sedoheptulose 7-phosphate isomerase
VTPAEQARAGLTALAALATRVGEEHAETIAAIADSYVAALRAGGTLFFAGNGGSAADAQHIAAEYVVRYGHNRRPLPAVALRAAGRGAGPFRGRARPPLDER